MRIVIVKLSAIGDVVHALPAVAALRRALPEAHIAWVAEKRAAGVLIDSPAIDELIEVDTRSWRKRMLTRSTIAEIRQAAARMRGTSGVDIAIDFQGLVKSGLVIQATRAHRRLGFETAELREPLSRRFLTEQISTARFAHVIDKNLALARAAAGCSGGFVWPVGADAYEFPIAVGIDDERFAERAAEECGDEFSILNPGGGWPTKCWPPASFSALADHLYDEHGLRSYITFGPGEEGLAHEIVANARSGTAVILRSTLKQFVALARRASLFVGGDTGPLHLAAAAGTPVVGIYGPTSPERNGPFDEHDLTVGRDLWCRAECYRRSCWHWECMDIPVSAITRAASQRLSGNRNITEIATALVQLEPSASR